MGGNRDDEAAVTALEAAVADTGALLVRAQRYRGGVGEAGTALAREALLLGDEARALHGRGGLDADASRALLGRARALGARFEALLAEIQAAPEYAAAIAAVAAGERAEVLRLLPLVFADLVLVRTPSALYHPLVWRRRGRPRAVSDLVAEVLRARDEGLTPEGDDLSRGADTRLPAVALLDTPLPDEPLALRLDTARVGPEVLRLADTGEYLAHVSTFCAVAGVHVADELPADELEAGPADYAGFRSELVAALGRAGVAVTTPAGASVPPPRPA